MRSFRVWAPYAASVAVSVSGERLAMQPEDQGWWRADIAHAAPECDYAFFLDGSEALPDPRSPWQPHGVHGASRMVDHGSFRWSDEGWNAPGLCNGVLYELHVGTFSPQGTFEAAIKGLDHLVDLGVSHIELMPVVEFPGSRGWGYDGVDLYAPHHCYGGPHGLKRLIDACHARGLGVLIDAVYNHCGPVGNYLGRFGPYLTDRYVTPWGSAINFDGRGSDEVRRFLCDNALMWLRDYHADGLRIDAVHAIFDMSAVHFLEQLAAEVHALEGQCGRRLVVIVESDLNDPRLVRAPELGGFGLDAQWSDDFHHALHAVLTGERSRYYGDFGTLADLAKALERGFVYDGRYSRYRGRRHGRAATGLPASRFIGYLQNHDQVGNRAKGERSSYLMSTGRLKVGAALLMTSPFMPMLFQGEEWGASSPFHYFTDHQDPVVAQAVREGRRREAGFAAEEGTPDPQAAETFESSKLRWHELEFEPHRSLLRWHRDLIELRRQRTELRDGSFEQVRCRFEESARWLAVERSGITVACNLGDRVQHVAVGNGSSDILLKSGPGVRLIEESVELPPDSVAILGRGGS